MEKTDVGLSIGDLWYLNNKAQGNFLYSGEDKRYIEAFLIQSCLLEGVLKKFAILTIKKNLPNSEKITKKKFENYNFDTAIDDLYLLKVISEEEFEALHDYRRKRNRYMHRLIERNFKNLNNEFRKTYKQGSPLVKDILEKLQKFK